MKQKLRELKAVRVVYCDLSGITRCRLVPSGRYEHVAQHGLGLVASGIGMPAWGDVPPADSPHQVTGEWRLVPDPDTFITLPWYSYHGHVMANLVAPPGTNWRCCPRQALQNAVTALKERFGLELKIGFETEFVLLDPKKRLQGSEHLPAAADDHTYCYASAVDKFAAILDDMVGNLRRMQLEVYQCHAEAAPGQFEIATAPFSPLQAADKVLLTKAAISAVARQHDLMATFLPKYFPDKAGNGLQFHFSLWQGENEVMSGSSRETLSASASSFVAGILRHLPALVCFTAPSTNSYRRIAPGCWSGAFRCWGNNNREAPLRVVFPPGPGEGGPHCEYKCSDGSSNPYVALAAVITAGMMGMEEKASLPPPVNVDPARMTEEERRQAQADALPTTLGDALHQLDEDQSFRDGFESVVGSDLVKTFLACRHADWNFFSAVDASKEVELLYPKF
ncbi:unnamed protein product [Ostreobium quekettii]|uniref:GS catalytic domain-containing protein n=1 Tax=Ostreobium quekettii TaxID=121088 RepID=A0A8S1IMC1_9CHLO|nr:unnamed protein product [Ostreobium quekettii]|eukprot:evm.model.scf_79.5 EVM.evm.TU.scf_79.5   scf_79:37331-44262(+)